MTPKACHLAARQHGLISVRQLTWAGMSRRQVQYAVEVGTLIVVRRGVYRLAGTPRSWEQVVVAAVLAAGGDAVPSSRPRPRSGPCSTATATTRGCT
jgi:hypothetical protein